MNWKDWIKNSKQKNKYYKGLEKTSSFILSIDILSNSATLHLF